MQRKRSYFDNEQNMNRRKSKIEIKNNESQKLLQLIHSIKDSEKERVNNRARMRDYLSDGNEAINSIKNVFANTLQNVVTQDEHTSVQSKKAWSLFNLIMANREKFKGFFTISGYRCYV